MSTDAIKDVILAHLPTQNWGMIHDPDGDRSGSYRTCSCGYRATAYYVDMDPEKGENSDQVTAKLLAEHITEQLEPALNDDREFYAKEALLHTAKDAKMRGDIGKEDGVEAEDWLAGLAETELPRRVIMDSQKLGRVEEFLVTEQRKQHNYHAPVDAGKITNILAGNRPDEDPERVKTGK